jgi:hypothetical protein
MRSVDFVYWLQGFFELSESDKALSPEQIQIIRNHLKLVFLYEIDPSYSDNKVVQQIFQNLHDGKDPLKGIAAEIETSRPPRPSDNAGTVYVKC